MADDFFEVPIVEQKEPRISISAIVGKNGDGKSSLTELIIRLINNCACQYGMNPQDRLLRIEGVKAELYYQSGNKILKMMDGADMIAPEIQHLATIEGETISNKQEIKTLSKDEIGDDFFYTLLNNYSHYAYNLKDFAEEINYGASGDSVEEKYWLFRVFHKNDGYQTPISLHPYRSWGTININREKELSDQRLLSLIMSSTSSARDELLMNINGKEPYKIELTMLNSTKLRETTIKERFEWYKDTNWLGDIADAIDRVSLNKKERKLFDFLKLDIITRFQQLAEVLRKNTKKNLYRRQLLGGILDLALEDKQKYLPVESDLKKFLDALMKVRKLDDRIDEIVETLQDFSLMSLAQLQWSLVIADVIEFWNKGLQFHDKSVKFRITPESLTCKEENLTTRTKSLHYIIYKTISIFDTYPEYRPTMAFTRDAPFFQKLSGENPISEDLQAGYKTLQKDCDEQSHITLKLRQVLRFYVDLKEGKAIWADKSIMERKLEEGLEELVWNVDIAKLRNKYDRKTFEDFELMPPRIFTWDIVFRLKDSKDKQDIPYRMFSSGEKQFLQVIGAVMYHLNNIDSIASTETRYRNINLIFEEIELYFHPEWQRQWVWWLMEMLRSIKYQWIKNVNILLVTHSPFVLSDIPKANVLFLKEGKPVYEMQSNTFGANIHNLLKNGFFLPGLPMGEFAHRKIDSIFEKLNSGDFPLPDTDKIEDDIMQVGELVLRNELMMLLGGYRALKGNERMIERILAMIAERRAEQ